MSNNKPIILLGGTGYIGSAIAQQLVATNINYHTVSRSDIDYTIRDPLIKFIKEIRPAFLINAAGYTGKPNVDVCEINKTECLQGNATLPGVIRAACEATGISWGHVSSGCIYTGSPNETGFKETDPPNFCFRTNNCSFYSGTKALGEELLAGAENVYVWRLRIPFNHIDSPRNYLSKLMRYESLLEATNSISHLNEFARVCVESWQKRIPFGTYNVTNTGAITTRRVSELINDKLGLDKEFCFFADEVSFMKTAAKTPRSNCVMDNSKLRGTGIAISQVEDALAKSLADWQWEHSPASV